MNKAYQRWYKYIGDDTNDKIEIENWGTQGSKGQMYLIKKLNFDK